ncbi:hypothetical protein [Natronorubrum sp. FCH18a]|uniref:hypothetical protein n=1 Tax=Natronorubrum sp. FCH18a TaxID=3447018 RepID=UPI003F510D72
MDVDEVPVDVHVGGILRLPADIPRKFVNEIDEEQRWLMVGAEPVGTVDDLGEFVMVEE